MLEDDIEALLTGHPEAIRRLAREVIGAITSSAPEAALKVAHGWHSVNLRHPAAGYVCGVFPFDDRVDVAFEAGTRLSDPADLLQAGSTGGKRVRYLRFLPGDPVDAEVLNAFVQESIALLSRR